MASADDLRDRRLYDEITRITIEYGALQRRTLRDLARSRADLANAHSVLGAAAHDLRTPLAAVLGFNELLLEDEELTPTQRELSERVHHAAVTMTTLTEELVEVVTAGSSPLRFDQVNLSLLVRHVVSRYELLHPARGVRVVMDDRLAKDVTVVVQGDEAKLERVLDNLVSNGVKFSRDAGYVRVGVKEDADHAEISVSDDGPGIPAEQQELIFAPFHREPGAVLVPGVGLGLTIVKQLTERHGGCVHVESVLGAGATFAVRLPLTGRGRAKLGPAAVGSVTDSRAEPGV